MVELGDIAKALGTSPEAARQKAIRGRWRRQRGNDGRALVLVDLEAEQARTRPDDARTKRPDDARTVAALDAHIATLLGDIAKADALAEQRHGELAQLSQLACLHGDFWGVRLRKASLIKGGRSQNVCSVDQVSFHRFGLA